MERWSDGAVERWSGGVVEWWSGGVVESVRIEVECEVHGIATTSKNSRPATMGDDAKQTQSKAGANADTPIRPNADPFP
jgi:hypothetical protein